MGFQIEDGRGKGKSLGITVENRAMTDAVECTIEHHVNHYHGLAFQMNLEQTPTGPDDCIVYMKNLDDVDMVVEEAIVYVSGACEIYVVGGDTGTPVGGNPVTPANCNLASGYTADGTFLSGNNITGLSGGTELFRFKFTGTTPSTSVNFPQDIIIPKNQTLTIYCDTGSITLLCSIAFNYHDAEGA
jgi:hypothetical protein